jgi:divalent metal cation (Fe/Co/Zn/Cd) transporter
MDTAPNRATRNKIRRLAETVPHVARVEKCYARKMGYHLYVDMHIEVDPKMTVERSHEIAHAVKDKIREMMPNVNDVLIHIEPHHGEITAAVNHRIGRGQDRQTTGKIS